MTTIEPTRFADAPAMLLAGIRRHHSFADVSQNIPVQWQEFIALVPLPGQIWFPIRRRD